MRPCRMARSTVSCSRAPSSVPCRARQRLLLGLDCSPIRRRMLSLRATGRWSIGPTCPRMRPRSCRGGHFPHWLSCPSRSVAGPTYSITSELPAAQRRSVMAHNNSRWSCRCCPIASSCFAARPPLRPSALVAGHRRPEDRSTHSGALRPSALSCGTTANWQARRAVQG